MMTTSDELRAWRSARRWTQQQAADELDYSLRAYAEYEKPDKAVPKWLALAITAMPPDKPVRSVHGTTLGDLSDEDNIRQADHELKRATTDAALADWARRWGECAVERLHKMSDIDEDEVTALAAAEGELTSLENKHTLVTDAAERLIKALDDIPDHDDALDKAIAALENAL